MHCRQPAGEYASGVPIKVGAPPADCSRCDPAGDGRDGVRAQPDGCSAAQRAAAARAAEEQAAQIEKMKEEIQKSEELSPEERENC